MVVSLHRRGILGATWEQKQDVVNQFRYMLLVLLHIERRWSRNGYIKPALGPFVEFSFSFCSVCSSSGHGLTLARHGYNKPVRCYVRTRGGLGGCLRLSSKWSSQNARGDTVERQCWSLMRGMRRRRGTRPLLGQEHHPVRFFTQSGALPAAEFKVEGEGMVRGCEPQGFPK
jgi:hypothetical protein